MVTPLLLRTAVNDREGSAVSSDRMRTEANIPPSQRRREADLGIRSGNTQARIPNGIDLHVRGLSKRYGSVVALDRLDLDVAPGELVALLGPSGSGKTTLLRTIAGLLHSDSGCVLFGKTDATRLSLRERNVGFVFQHYA